jgi:N-acetylmuramoyl-L-alanine amidase
VFLFIIGSFLLKGLEFESHQITYNSAEYRDLAVIARELNMRWGWSLNRVVFRMRQEGFWVDAAGNSRRLVINGMPVSLGFPLVKSRGRMFVSVHDYEEVIRPLFTPQLSLEGANLDLKGVIILDPGHGGKDPGAHNPEFNLKEKALTLDVSLRLKSLLEASGYEVLFTRNTDRYLKLEERSSYANSTEADFFISIHFNAAENKKASGIECFALTPQGQASTGRIAIGVDDLKNYPGNAYNSHNALLAYCLQEALVDHVGGIDRGFKRARFKVLKDLEMPGALVELGFISHAATAGLVGQASERHRIAEGLHAGILYYYKKIQKMVN